MNPLIFKDLIKVIDHEKPTIHAKISCQLPIFGLKTIFMMKKNLNLFCLPFLLLMSLLFCVNSFAQNFQVKDLRVGDVLLVSLNCMQCRYIESETNSTFSHSGIVVENLNGEVVVAQALGALHKLSLKDFLKPITPGSVVTVMRSRESGKNSGFKKLNSIFEEHFLGLPFDGDYLWNNFDSRGYEKIYCSELIYKLLNFVLDRKLIPGKLSYQKHYDYWKKLYRGNVPENAVGNSPAMIFDDTLNFNFLGNLKLN